MAVEKLSVELEFKDGKLVGKITGINAALGKMDRQSRRTSKSVDRIARSVGGFGAKLRSFLITVSLSRAALHNIWLVTGQWQRSIITTTAELEKMMFLLKGLSQASTEQEKLNDATEDFNKIMELAKTAPFTVEQITKSWVKFKAVGLDPADGSLRSMLDAIAAFGGSDEELHRASVAIQQMGGKGVISMEELRQQLGEAVPTALKNMSKGMQISMKEMVDRISRGEVEAKRALQKFFNELQIAYGGKSQALMESFSGSVARLSTSWKLMQKELAEGSGFFDTVKVSVRELTAAMDSPEAKQFGLFIGRGMANMAAALVDGIKAIIKYREEIGAVIKAIAVFGAFTMARWMLMLGVSAIKAATVAWTAFAAKVNFTAAALLRAKLATGAWAAKMQAALIVLGRMISANPALFIANVAAAVIAAVFAWRKFGKSIAEATEEFRKLGDAVTEQDQIDFLGKRKAQEAAVAQKKNLLDYLLRQKNADQQKIDLMRESLAKEKALLAEMDVQLVNARAVLDERQLQESLRAIDRATEAKVRAVEEQFRAQETQAEQLLVDETIAEDERSKRFTEARRKIIAERSKAVMDMLEEERRKAVLAREAALDGLTGRDRENRATLIDKEIAQLTTLIGQYEEFFRNQSEVFERPNLFLENLSNAMDPLSRKAGMLRGNMAELAAELGGLEGAGEKIRAQWAAGIFDDDKGNRPAREQMELLVKMAEAHAVLNDKVREKRAIDNDAAGAAERLSNWLSATTEELALVNEALELGSMENANSRVRQFSRQVGIMLDEMKRAGYDTTEFAAAIKQVEDNLASLASGKRVFKLRQEIEELRLSMIGNPAQQFNARVKSEREDRLRTLEAEKASAQTIAQEMDMLAQKHRLMLEQFNRTQPIQRLEQEWGDSTTRMKEAGENWIRSAVDGIIEMAETGKFEFGEMTKSILKDILRIMLQMQIANLIGGIFGGGPTATASSTTGNLPVAGVVNSAMGNIVSGDGAMPLRKFAKGGIARRPMVSVFGEGDDAEAYVPLPDGRTIPVTLKGNLQGGGESHVQVNVINETGQPVNAEKRSQRFDGKQMILDVVLSAASNPGPFRDGMKQGLK